MSNKKIYNEINEIMNRKDQPADVARDLDTTIETSRSRLIGYIQKKPLMEKLTIYVSNQLRAAFDHGYQLGAQSNTASRLARTKANKTKSTKRKTKAKSVSK